VPEVEENPDIVAKVSLFPNSTRRLPTFLRKQVRGEEVGGWGVICNGKKTNRIRSG